MKIIDTVVLVAYVNPLDPRCEKATRHITSISEIEEIFVPSATLLEFDLELKAHEVSDEERESVHSRLLRLIPSENILPITPAILKRAARLSPKARWRGAYFDTLIVATGLEYNARLALTTDHRFPKLGLETTF